MPLTLREIGLFDFRSFAARSIELAGGLTILCGANATGKTNTVEALQLLTAGTSFRNPRTSDLVRDGADSAKVTGRIEGDGRVIDVELIVESGRKRFRRNGKPARPQDLSSTLMSVLFTPDDLQLVKAGAAARRDELDVFGAQAAPSFARVRSAFIRALDQRNRLLKEDSPDLGLIDAWSDQVPLGGATLLKARLALFERLRDHMRPIYEGLAREPLDLAYECTLGEGIKDLSRDQIRDLFLERLTELRSDELRRRQTLVGPQRDDVRFQIAGRDARSFASQGQQRSVVLAWKMAEVEICREVTQNEPILLLDDVMSELDESRRGALTRLIERGAQSVVTTANLDYFPKGLLEGAEVVRFGK